MGHICKFIMLKDWRNEKFIFAFLVSGDETWHVGFVCLSFLFFFSFFKKRGAANNILSMTSQQGTLGIQYCTFVQWLYMITFDCVHKKLKYSSEPVICFKLWVLETLSENSDFVIDETMHHSSCVFS